MSFQEDVQSSIEALRKERAGLNPETLAKQPILLSFLDTSDPAEGARRLVGLVNQLADTDDPSEQDDALALRAAMAVGFDRLKNVSARRRALRESGHFYRTERTQFYAEDRARERLVTLVIGYKNHQTDGTSLDESEHKIAAASGEPDDQPPSPAPGKKARFTKFLSDQIDPVAEERLKSRGYSKDIFLPIAAVAIVLTVGVVGLNQGWLAKRGSASGTDTSTAPPQAVISASPDAKIDNSGGWGPDRKTFTMEKPAPYPVFNSITNSRPHGDERNFVQCRDKEGENRDYRDQVIAEDGHSYICYLFFNNAITPGFGSRVIDGKEYPNPASALQNAKARVLLPSKALYNPGVKGILSADNSTSVWDSCNFVAPKRVKFAYVPGSATLHTKGVAKGGVALKESDVTSGLMTEGGALLGDRQDGYLYQHGGHLLFELTVSLEDD
ncbi:hypothetical protein [Streptomyces sp. PvR018]|uniref:hypothetical protein n=1 Tax=Streptomyces sp. PvR018 TaxID=3156442 RepID=UPI003398CA03